MMKKKPVIKFDVSAAAIFVTAILCVGMLVKGVMYQPAISAHNRKAEEINASIEYENQKIKEIDENTQRIGTNEYIEEIAREKLGMIKTDEIVFVDISGQN